MTRRANILVVGSGGREHALAWRFRAEGHEVLVAPGSDGIALDAAVEAIDVDRFDDIVTLARKRAVDLVVIGPERPLVAGLADRCRAAGLATIGPAAAAAELEGSKAAAKAFMVQHGIPTARHVTVTSLEQGLLQVRGFSAPPVVKASGLAAGKGVIVCESFEHAQDAVRACLQTRSFGDAGATVVLEERLHGQELSVFVLCDGERGASFMAAQDHKRLCDGDRGPNTGGMGAFVPVPFYDAELARRVEQAIVEPTLAALRSESRPFVGVLFFGLMVDERGDAFVIEYNCRFGDPEAQPILFGLTEPIVLHLLAAAHGKLNVRAFTGRPAANIVVAAAGYPDSPRRGDVIRGLALVERMPDVKVFHAGTSRLADGTWVSNGGRVLGVCARGERLDDAIDRAYNAVREIDLEGGQMRLDIGRRFREIGAK